MELVEIIKIILEKNNAELTAEQIRDKIISEFPDRHNDLHIQSNNKKGELHNASSLLLEAVYNVTAKSAQFTQDKSIKPMIIGLNRNKLAEKKSEPYNLDKELKKVLSPRYTRAKIELSSRLGRILEDVSYSTLLKVILTIIFGCAVYFFFATSFGHGIKVSKDSFSDIVRWDALYFSIVTFTSLGYGDLSPEGIGKVIASFEVLAGIILMAMFIGKIASERQSTLLLLLSTSDNQRRLRELEENVDLSNMDISTALNEQDQSRAGVAAKRGVSLIASIRKYLTFQANQAQLTEFGNTSSLRDLYAKLREYQQMTIDLYKLSVARGSARASFEKIVREVHAIAEIMVEFHPNDLDCKNTFLHIGLNTKKFLVIKADMDSGIAKETYLSELNESLLIHVHNFLKSMPFDKNSIKNISDRLNISRRMAQRCVNELVAREVYRIPSGELTMQKNNLFKKLEEKKARLKRRSVFNIQKKIRINKNY